MAPLYDPSTSSSPLGNGVLELNWDIFGETCRALAVKVARSGYDPELIIGIAKAGVIPGAVIASMLQRDFFSMKISRRSGTERVYEEPQILTAAPPQATGRRVLIVDEICTSGATLKLARAAVHHVAPADIMTATAFARTRGYRPDYHAVETDATVIFPWDRQVVDHEGELMPNPLYDGVL